MSMLLDSQAIWEKRYRQALVKGSKLVYEPWLQRWHRFLTPRSGALALDLGCGRGYDSYELSDSGFQVVAADFAWTALQAAQQRTLQARVVQVDLRDGLPFADAAFQVVVANLSLHYFSHQQTCAILRQIRHCLAAHGLFLARFNSSNDVNFGAVGHPEVEPGYFLVDGEYKRFFDHSNVVKLFEDGWQLHNCEEMTTQRSGKPKVLWEVVVEKTPISQL